MNNYEHTFISKQDLPESQAKKLIAKYEDIIKKNSGKILKIEEWGLMSLARKIKKYNPILVREGSKYFHPERVYSSFLFKYPPLQRYIIIITK